MSERNENKVYIIPPDFIQSGTLFGGLVKFRNALEAAVLAFLAGFPVLKLHIGLTANYSLPYRPAARCFGAYRH